MNSSTKTEIKLWELSISTLFGFETFPPRLYSDEFHVIDTQIECCADNQNVNKVKRDPPKTYFSWQHNPQVSAGDTSQHFPFELLEFQLNWKIFFVPLSGGNLI